MKRLLIIITMMLAVLPVRADHIRVRLFSSNSVSTLNVSFDLGSYNLYADNDTLLEDMVGEGRSVLIRAEKNGLRVSVNEDNYGIFKKVRLEATDTACILCLNPEGCKQRTYEGDLEVTPMARVRDIHRRRGAKRNIRPAERHLPYTGHHQPYLGFA